MMYDHLCLNFTATLQSLFCTSQRVHVLPMLFVHATFIVFDDHTTVALIMYCFVMMKVHVYPICFYAI